MLDARVMRDRQDEAVAAVRRMASSQEPGSEAILVQTRAVGAYPTAAASFFACTPLRIDGPEVEGARVSFTPDSSRTIIAFNLGVMPPPVGTKLIAHACGGRWAFRYDG